MATITLTPPTHAPTPYPILIGKGVLTSLPDILSTLGSVDHIVILCDRRVESIAERVGTIVGSQHILPVESGEQSKSLQELERLAGELLRIGATKSSLLIAVGGGMVTDLGGFLASIYMRGIRVVHVPTSMLGMVDASVGGKTGVELGLVKNVLGSIHHPSAIVSDTDVLAGLPDPQLREGIVEVIKEAAMLDADVFAWFEKSLTKILKRDGAALERCIVEGVRMKSVVVQADDRDASHRHFLNFGHTIGHAVEAHSQFSISHGRAVSIGMVAEMSIAKVPGADRVTKLLQAMEMPLEIPSKFSLDDLWTVIQSDKKKKAGVVRMFVPEEIGKGHMIPLSREQFLRLR
jgi:3-dehydroquinate synthase